MDIQKSYQIYHLLLLSQTPNVITTQFLRTYTTQEGVLTLDTNQ